MIKFGCLVIGEIFIIDHFHKLVKFNYAIQSFFTLLPFKDPQPFIRPLSGVNDSNSSLASCVFCNSKNTTFGNTPEFKRIIEDKLCSRILFETENFAIFPSVGQIVEGYLLIMPKTHVSAISNLKKELLDELEYVYSEVKSILKKHYAEPIFFEHGVCRSHYEFNGSCVDHAHIHAVPAPVNVSKELKKDYKYTKINSVADLGKYEGTNYLYIDDISGDKLILEANDIPSQLIRYRIADELNMPSKGDWYLYPGKDEMLNTIKKLSGVKIKKFREAMLVVGKDAK